MIGTNEHECISFVFIRVIRGFKKEYHFLALLPPFFIFKAVKKLYIFSGLGADERIFRFLDLSGYDVSFIKWITPLKKEPIESYAKRLIEQITTPRPILIGLSFGGMMAIEVGKIIDTEKIIIISSAQTGRSLPFLYRMAGALNLHKLVPHKIFQHPNFLFNWLFSAKTEREKKLLAEILPDTDLSFIKWAVNAILHWKNETKHPHLVHIHGDADRLLPARKGSYDVNVIGGGHLMIASKADEMSRVLRELIETK